MPRTTDAAVKKILKTVDAISTVSFIEAANNLVTAYIVGECAATYSAATLELIERYLACHFYRTRDRDVTSRSTGRASGQYQGQSGYNFQATQYGQDAMMLDFKGYLKRLQDGNKTATVTSLHTDYTYGN